MGSRQIIELRASVRDVRIQGAEPKFDQFITDSYILHNWIVKLVGLTLNADKTTDATTIEGNLRFLTFGCDEQLMEEVRSECS